MRLVLLFLLFAGLLFAVPIAENVILNTTTGLNTSAENLTLYYDAYNQSDELLLNMLFGYGSNSTWTRDYSEYGNNGTVVNATWNYNGGHDGQGAYEFLGAEYINVTDSMTFGDTISVCAWAKPNETSINRHIVAKRDGSDDGFILRANTNAFDWVIDSGTAIVVSTSTVSAGDWYHVCGTYNGSDVIIYLNGELANNDSISGAIDNSQSLLIGASQATPSYFWNGSIDDVVIYNRSLSASEIKKLYGAGTAKAITNWYADGEPMAILNMPFEGGSNSTYTKDYSNYSNDGTVVNATYNSTGGYDGWGAYEFDGLGTNHITTPNINFLDAFTISVFYKPVSRGEAGYGRLFGKAQLMELYNGNSDTNLILNYFNSTFNTNSFGIPNCFSMGNWNHVAVVFDAGADNITVYCNGVIRKSEELNGGIGTPLNPLYIGDTFSLDRAFNGSIDDVMVFNRSLTAEEIWNLYSNNTREIPHEETWGGETWYSCVTPNDGTEDGNEVCSEAVTLSSSCEVISYPGTYTLVNDISGANPLSGVDSITQACVVIASDDVTFDCNGYSVTNDGTADAGGIVVNGSTTINYENVTIQNCDVSRYERGAYLYRTTQDTIRNSTAWNNTRYGIYLLVSTYINLTNNTAYNNTHHGFLLSSSSNSNTLTNNTAYSNSLYGFYLYSSSSNTLANNAAYGNTQYGIYLSSSTDSIVENNTVHENLQGIRLESSTGNNITNCTLYDNTYGIYASDANATIRDTIASDLFYLYYGTLQLENVTNMSSIWNNNGIIRSETGFRVGS